MNEKTIPPADQSRLDMIELRTLARVAAGDAEVFVNPLWKDALSRLAQAAEDVASLIDNSTVKPGEDEIARRQANGV